MGHCEVELQALKAPLGCVNQVYVSVNHVQSHASSKTKNSKIERCGSQPGTATQGLASGRESVQIDDD